LSTLIASPTPSLEQRLAGYWCELLGVDSVAPKDHFFEMGGNSLLATNLANLIEDELGVRPEMGELVGTLEEAVCACDNLLKALHASS
jgi:acyl carrier protein